MHWLYLTLLGSFFLAVCDGLSKLALRTRSEAAVALCRLAVPFLFLAPFADWSAALALPPRFWLICLALAPLEAAAMLLYQRAIRLSPLSVTVPFLAFTPVFLLFTSRLALGERPTPAALAGILLIAAGVYVLGLGPGAGGLLGPLKSLFRAPGPRYMLLVAAVYSLTSIGGKAAVSLAGPALFAPLYMALIVGAILPVFLFRKKTDAEAAGAPRAGWRLLLLVGLASALSVWCHFTALSLAPVSYMIPVKRTSLLFGILIGWLFFKEKNIPARLGGGALMVVGVALIALGG